MTWAGSQTYNIILNQYIFIDSDTFTANGDISTSVDFPCSEGTIFMDVTAGSSATDIDLEYSVNGSAWTSAVNFTESVDTQKSFSSKVGRYWRINVTTIGSGNDIDFYWILKRW